MVGTIYRSWFVRAALCSTLLFTAVAVLTKNDHFMVGLRTLQIGMAMAVLIAYSKNLIAAMLSPNPDPFERILLGIEGSFFGLLLAGIIAYLWRLSGQPRWIYHADLAGFPIWINIQAGAMHLWARGAIGGGMPPRERVLLGLVLAVSIMLALVMFAYSGEVTVFLEWLRPFLEEEH